MNLVQEQIITAKFKKYRETGTKTAKTGLVCVHFTKKRKARQKEAIN